MFLEMYKNVEMKRKDSIQRRRLKWLSSATPFHRGIGGNEEDNTSISMTD